MRERQKGNTISVRLTAEEQRLVRRVARRRRVTASEVIRDAVGHLADEERQGPVRPYDQIADLVGSVRGLPADLAERTGERFAEIVREKAGRRK